MPAIRKKQIRSILFSALLTALMVLPLAANAAHTDTPATSAEPTDKDLAASRCAIGEERFLPGDYYYCLATQTYGEHRYESAQKFFATAASWASKPAQYVLGIMALNGDHQPMNHALALAWLALASERPNSDFRPAYDSAYGSASADERRTAEQLLTTMRATYADAVAAVRAEQRYAQGMAELSRRNTGNNTYCMEGIATLAQPVGDPSMCPPVPLVVKSIDLAAVNVFEGWTGHVSVGPLQPVGTSPVAKPNAK